MNHRETATTIGTIAAVAAIPVALSIPAVWSVVTSVVIAIAGWLL
jgi:hypothetical protein